METPVTPFKIVYWKISIIVILFLLLYYPTFVGLVEQWSQDPNYSHGFLVPFISAYLLWESKEAFLKSEVAPSNAGLFILMPGLFLFILGTVGEEFFATRLSLIIVLAGIVFFLCGKNLFMIALLPIGYLFFMVPFPEILFNAIAFPLKLFAAKISTDIIQLVNIPVFREGNIIQLADVTLEVADACSGIRSLMSMLALGVAYAYFSQKTLLKKISVTLLAIPITIFANVTRVTGTGILAHYVGPEAAMGFFHEFAGFLIFGVGFTTLLLVGTLIGKVGK